MLNREEYKKEFDDALTQLQNARYQFEWLQAQMNLENDTPLNKMAFRGMTKGVELLEKATDELFKGAAYDPADRVPRVNNCHLCDKFGNCHGKCEFTFAG